MLNDETLSPLDTISVTVLWEVDLNLMYSMNSDYSENEMTMMGVIMYLKTCHFHTQ